MADHEISWLNIPGYKPETWNPFVGCTKVSEGCDHCYAERMANRLASNPKTAKKYANTIDNGKWSGMVNFDMDVIFNPPNWKQSRAVFVCSMSDLFHETNPFTHIDHVVDVIAANPQHIFIVITKRPERMFEYFIYRLRGYNAIPNLWLGVTAENQQLANKRIPILLQVPAGKRFVSIEPMLGHINLFEWEDDYSYNWLNGSTFCDGMNEPVDTNHLDWVIVGGETGPGARPMHPDWVRSVRDQCKNDGVPFFFKQYGKKILGRELDGHIYHEFPKI